MVIDCVTRKHRDVDGFGSGKSEFHCHAFNVGLLIDGDGVCHTITFDLHSEKLVKITKIGNIVYFSNFVLESLHSLIQVAGHSHIISSDSDDDLLIFLNNTSNEY